MERLYTIPRASLTLLLVALLVVLALAGRRLAAVGANTQPAAAPLVEARTSGRQALDARLVVHVVGAVRRAGLYRLPDGARVADAVARAGGATRRAEIAAVNLAAPLADGQQVVVPARLAPAAAKTAGAAGAGASSTPGGKVSLGVATVDDLDELPGIGPVTAQKIVDWRTAHGAFSSVDDLDAVPGIGPARIEQLRELVTP
jgi:competence protein ComEA